MWVDHFPINTSIWQPAKHTISLPCLFSTVCKNSSNNPNYYLNRKKTCNLIMPGFKSAISLYTIHVVWHQSKEFDLRQINGKILIHFKEKCQFIYKHKLFTNIKSCSLMTVSQNILCKVCPLYNVGHNINLHTPMYRKYSLCLHYTFLSYNYKNYSKYENSNAFLYKYSM